MECSEEKFLLPLYESGELDARSLAEFEGHLQHCAVCKREAEQIVAYDRVLRDACTEEPLDARALRSRVRQQIDGPERKRRFPLSGRPIYLLAFTVLIAISFYAGIIYFVTRPTVDNIYLSAIEDHSDEVVRHAPVRGWRETPIAIAAFVQRELGDQDLVARLTLPGLQLERVRLCELSGENYVHFVYKGDQGELSFFVRPRGDTLPGVVVETVHGCGLHAEVSGGFEAAGFSSDKFTVLLVSDLSAAANLQFVREVAMRIA